MVENIRIKLASGLYSKADCWLDIRNTMSWEDFDDIAEYRTHTEVRKDLEQRVLEVPKATKLFNDYQIALRNEYVIAEKAELLGNKHKVFEDRKEVLLKELVEKLKEYPTVTLEELPKFLKASLNS